jgi:hypothetical protein
MLSSLRPVSDTQTCSDACHASDRAALTGLLTLLNAKGIPGAVMLHPYLQSLLHRQEGVPRQKLFHSIRHELCGVSSQEQHTL